MLEIYKASAGAGKTHLLVKYYLEWILFGGTRFNEILAVTFTNKATAEMKSRIVADLYRIATDATRSDYWNDFSREHPKVTAETLQKKARKALSDILGDYSSFQVSTIDKFFQTIVRAFTRELRLQGNYEIELNDDRILDQAVSSFLTEIDPQRDAQAYRWLQDFSRSLVENNESWNLSTSLRQASRQITKDAYQRIADEIQTFTVAETGGLKDYAQMVAHIVFVWESEMRKTGRDVTELIAREGLDIKADFSGKARTQMLTFVRLREGEWKEPSETFRKWADDPDMWYAKGVAARLSGNATDIIRTAMKNVLNHFDGTTFRNYKTAVAIRQNIFQLGLLANIEQRKREICDEQGIMLLSSTTELLNRLIGKSEAPFIYEKTGSRIESYMIDEFQDTSLLQWDNFKPLLENSLATDSANLIVGDVKQSIYRWRGSEWALLDHGVSLQPRRDDTKTLRTNWRSKPEIVEWNNAFFSQIEPASPEMKDEVRRIYKDVEQALAPCNTEGYGGLVHVEAASDVMERLPEVIQDILTQGYEPRDIAILTRTNDEGTEAAEKLITAGISIISDEALTLISRPVIQTLVAVMKHLQNPRVAILRAIADFKVRDITGREMLPDICQYTNRPLYELVEGLIQSLELNGKGDEAFLQAFRDLVLEFAMSKSADLTTFLSWWNEHGRNKAISSNSEQNSVRLLTIHKSKGLGIPVVIIPYASWEMDMRVDGRGGNILWCRPEAEPFKLENVALPISVSKMEGTIFEPEYLQERQRVIIDNLNTTYVAFTRAKEQLWLLYPAEHKKGGKHALWQDLEAFVQNDRNGVQACGEGVWEKGQRKTPSERSPQTIPTEPAQTSVASSDTLKLPTLLRSQIVKDEEAVMRGNCIHEAMSSVITRDTASEAVHHFYRTTSDDYRALFSEDELQARIAHYLENEKAKGWFERDVNVINEQTILLPSDDEHRRPDRVIVSPDGTATVIDYKTGKPEKKHQIQVAAYGKRLREMGFDRVKACLWYLESNEIVTVWE